MNESDIGEKFSNLSPYCKDFHDIVSKANGKVAIFTHRYPEPDAIGSMMALAWFFDRAYHMDCSCFVGGKLSHPQNIAMSELLGPDLTDVGDYDHTRYALNIVVDATVFNADIGSHEIKFDVTFDHHPLPPIPIEGLYVNLGAGSAAATIYDLIKNYNLRFEEGNEEDSRVVTAILVAIQTDTENQMSDDVTHYEFDAYRELFQYRDATMLHKIVRFKRPATWVKMKAEAALNYVGKDGVAITGLGLLDEKQRDILADMADDMSKWNGIDTAVAFAVFGDRIEGCVRSNNPSVSVKELCSELAGNHGKGYGKTGKGAYCIPMAKDGYGLVTSDEDEETQCATWNLICQKETKRIFKISKK
jgi:nanoRNase/pAp phosphatase (c-di-AMP/oligoRNAs hydrolase)